eukprot:CAMPEP_0202407908 /NCGR_PEP_ID=MMETSP1128-20130828/13525_1 /ASSEMBLY_ACC=CAM_ASM_000463 /TAXON_ID=3047 /ORGANISM="Dunaliella tertiolecta, Strain CCMP1320" /LENGTH=235 /DNA_ID=CAMNT_0049012987 /DNA_START=118 /DNA_END=822 /DNA_ORIENTATION=+
MQPNLEALLEDVLKDFDVQPTVPHQPSQLAQGPPPAPACSHSLPPDSTQPAAATADDSSRQAPGAPSHAAGPSGLGLSLPSRASSSRPDSKAPQAGKATPGGLTFDPLRKGTARPSAKQQQQQPTSQGRQLPPDVQKLADDLMRLVNESNIGSDAGSQGPPSTSDGPAAAAAAAGAAHHAAGSMQGTDAGRASTIQGLMEHTKRTVAAQSKFSRGERGPEGNSQAGGSQPPLGGP